MKRVALSLAAAMALTTAPASAQELGPPTGGQSLAPTPGQGPGFSRSEILRNPHDVAGVANTPSRIRRSHREMNRDRPIPVERHMSARQARQHARDLIQRADIQCEVAEAMMVAVTSGNIPVVEVDCADSGGLVITDTLPIQATDCLDFSMPDPSGDDAPYLRCQLPGNVAMLRRQSARN